MSLVEQLLPPGHARPLPCVTVKLFGHSLSGKSALVQALRGERGGAELLRGLLGVGAHSGGGGGRRTPPQSSSSSACGGSGVRRSETLADDLEAAARRGRSSSGRSKRFSFLSFFGAGLRSSQQEDSDGVLLIHFGFSEFKHSYSAYLNITIPLPSCRLAVYDGPRRSLWTHLRAGAREIHARHSHAADGDSGCVRVQYK